MSQNITTWEYTPSYDDANDSKYGRPFNVPLKVASEESFKEYGRIVRDFEAEEVMIVQWPVAGRRPILRGTGMSGVVSGRFSYAWDSDVIYATNDAINMAAYLTGRLPADVSPTNRSHVLVREANYHPDGGQVFYTENGAAFVALLALPGDDIKLEDFVAFYCDGSFGMQINPSVWHQAMYPMADRASFLGKQGVLCTCVQVDTVEEFGKYLRVR